MTTRIVEELAIIRNILFEEKKSKSRTRQQFQLKPSSCLLETIRSLSRASRARSPVNHVHVSLEVASATEDCVADGALCRSFVDVAMRRQRILTGECFATNVASEPSGQPCKTKHTVSTTDNNFNCRPNKFFEYSKDCCAVYR